MQATDALVASKRSVFARRLLESQPARVNAVQCAAVMLDNMSDLDIICVNQVSFACSNCPPVILLISDEVPLHQQHGCFARAPERYNDSIVGRLFLGFRLLSIA